MKTPTFRIFSAALIACFALSLTLLTATVATAADKVSLPVGKWKVTFANGIFETVEIKADGSATVTEAARKSKGKASINNGYIEIRFDDDRIERWSLDSAHDRLTVQHWHPVSAMPDGMPTIGNAARHDAKFPALEVHEWGTFTVLQGSNGQVIPWYQAPDKLVDLPPFVKQSIRIMSKSGTFQGGKDTVRMETPVLYFYPEEKMDVTVSANFANGRITEIFPPAFRPGFGGPTIWHGSLLPPQSAERKKVPAATGPKGRHYAAAREVPEAWLFHNRSLPKESLKTTDANATSEEIVAQLVSTNAENEKAVEPIDHFIFYRGAGNHGFHELHTAQGAGPDKFTLSNYGGETIPKLFALRVGEGQSSWLTLEDLKKVEYTEGKAYHQRTITFPAPMGPTSEVAADLRTAMVASLHAEGLTQDEAAAMVATWDDLWFTEPGTRILAILPQAFADRMVPLTIIPKPTKIDRVFVARVEILTRETEEKLTSLLRGPAIENSDEAEIGEDASKLSDLQLGRYAAGGMERAVQLLEWQTRNRFAKLEQVLKEQQKVEEEGKLAAKGE
jgi:hypothetical protein